MIKRSDLSGVSIAKENLASAEDIVAVYVAVCIALKSPVVEKDVKRIRESVIYDGCYSFNNDQLQGFTLRNVGRNRSLSLRNYSTPQYAASIAKTLDAYFSYPYSPYHYAEQLSFFDMENKLTSSKNEPYLLPEKQDPRQLRLFR